MIYGSPQARSSGQGKGWNGGTYLGIVYVFPSGVQKTKTNPRVAALMMRGEAVKGKEPVSRIVILVADHLTPDNQYCGAGLELG